MLIYTGNAYGDDLEHVKRLGMGIMLASSASTYKPDKAHAAVPCALDNGAFQAWRRGFPFQADVFRATIAAAYKAGLTLDFIVCPDIVAGGKRSLDYSIRWATGELETCGRLALAVQDGMTTQDVAEIGSAALARFTHVFVGGTEDWKWTTAAEWVRWAHARKLRAHIGRCGTLDRLRYAQSIGADSVDSTNFVRNKAWRIVEEFQGRGQLRLCMEAGRPGGEG